MAKNSSSLNIYNLIIHPVSILCVLALMLAILLNRFAMEIDVGLWNYVSRLWLYHGIPPYIGAVENKTPGIFYIFVLSNFLFGLNLWFPRILSLCAMLASSFFLYQIGIRLYNRTCGIIALTMFGLTCCQERIIGFSVTTEMFMVMFSTGAFLTIIHAGKAKNRIAYSGFIFLTGFFMGCAISFKQIALMSIASIFFFYLFLPNKFISPYKRILLDSCIFGFGVILAIICFFIPLFLSGVNLCDIWECTVYMLAYSGRFTYAKRIISFFEGWYHVNLILFYPILFVFLFQVKSIKEKMLPFWSIISWIFFDFLAVNAPAMYFNHQFLQLIPSITIASSITITMFLHSSIITHPIRTKRTAQFIIGLFIILAPYQPVLDWIFIKPKILENKTLSGLKELGLWIKGHSSIEEKLFIFSRTAGVMLVYADRMSVSRHFNRMFAHAPYIKKEMARDIKQAQPKYIIFKKKIIKAKWLLDIIKKQYNYKTTLYKYDIFKRKYQ